MLDIVVVVGSVELVVLKRGVRGAHYISFREPLYARLDVTGVREEQRERSRLGAYPKRIM